MTLTTTATPDPFRSNALETLCATLRSIRLPSMAKELPELLETAEREGWGQLELLKELFEREAVQKRTRRYQRHLKASDLSEAYAIERFDFDLAQKHGIEPGVVRDLAQCVFIRARRNIILAGGVGTGKSHLARTLGIEALKRGFKVLAFNTAELVDTLYTKRSSFHFGRVYGTVRDPDLVILDDLGTCPTLPIASETPLSRTCRRHDPGQLWPGMDAITSPLVLEDLSHFQQHPPSASAPI